METLADALPDLRTLREALGFDQRQMAEALGVKQPRMSRLETGKQFLTGSQKILVRQLAAQAAKRRPRQNGGP